MLSTASLMFKNHQRLARYIKPSTASQLRKKQLAFYRVLQRLGNILTKVTDVFKQRRV